MKFKGKIFWTLVGMLGALAIFLVTPYAAQFNEGFVKDGLGFDARKLGKEYAVSFSEWASGWFGTDAKALAEAERKKCENRKQASLASARARARTAKIEYDECMSEARFRTPGFPEGFCRTKLDMQVATLAVVEAIKTSSCPLETGSTKGQ